MTLNPNANYPSHRSYVLKLHRDAEAVPDRIAGRIENMVSGAHVDFASAADLVAWLSRDLCASRGVHD